MKPGKDVSPSDVNLTNIWFEEALTMKGAETDPDLANSTSEYTVGPSNTYRGT